MATNGMILYRGPSVLNGSPIVVVATGLATSSDNKKTGAMVQTWIIRDDMSPVDAVKTGADNAICGDCPHRGTSCYVPVFQAPLSVFKSVQRGIYPTATSADAIAEALAGKMVRLGSYGDPAAVPMWVWDAAISRASGHTGYTHQWRKAPELARYVMASADSPSDHFAAKLLGFRVFRVRTETQPVEDREVICPASAEAGYKTNCATCRACGGLSARAKADITIVAHGAASKVRAFNRLSAA